MSEITRGVIGMPFEMAMQNEFSRRQFHSIAQALLTERDQLRAELAGLRTGFDAQNEVIAGLRAQMDTFRRAVAWAIQIHKDPELSHEIPNREWLDDLDAAMGKGGEA